MAQKHVQGDVIMDSIDSLPDEAMVAGHNVLAEGEATGHAHRADATAQVWTHEDGLYMSSPEKITVLHEEHNNVTVTPGLWKVTKQQEYDHFAREARDVRD